jgi:phosphoglycolate phosphatase-like HAD superfamily hydrolase
MEKNILILDFDGVVCDGLNECLLSAWNTWYGLDVDAFDPITLGNIPKSFVKKFTHYRNFLRHSGQFVMPFLLDSDVFKSWEEFDNAFKSISSQSVESFITRFEEYRVNVINNKYDQWIRMHEYYDGIIEVLKNEANQIFIVSGKDQHSIVEILRSQGVLIPESRIFGSMRSKIPALIEIAEDVGRNLDHLKFYDDNLTNVLEAREAGFCANWALWGYKTDDDIKTSIFRKVPQVGLNDFTSEFS